MTPQQLLLAEAAEWIRKAKGDLRTAQVVLANQLDEAAVYHCQQTAEKALKAFLTLSQIAFRKTHNLKELGDACTVLDPTLKPIAEMADELTEYAWLFRYPGSPRIPGHQEALDARATAEQVYNEIAERLPAVVCP